MRIIDVSMALGPKTHAYPGDAPFWRRETRSMAEGEALNLSALSLSSHAGTHIDAPYHFVADGAPVHELPVDVCSGPALVADLRGVEGGVETEDLEGVEVRPGDVVLLRTRNSDRLEEPAFFRDYVYLAESGARRLLEREVRAVGIDYLSIEGFHVEGYPVHRLLLGHGVGIIEGLNLAPADPGRYTLLCFPLKIVDGDGGPARAVLVEEGALRIHD